MYVSLKVTRNETADGIFYYRGCSELVCDSYLSEFCNEYGEAAEAVTVSKASCIQQQYMYIDSEM